MKINFSSCKSVCFGLNGKDNSRPWSAGGWRVVQTSELLCSGWSWLPWKLTIISGISFRRDSVMLIAHGCLYYLQKHPIPIGFRRIRCNFDPVKVTVKVWGYGEIHISVQIFDCSCVFNLGLTCCVEWFRNLKWKSDISVGKEHGSVLQKCLVGISPWDTILSCWGNL